ncbi:dihydrofolate reductase [Ferruginivarius sediminum]|uniref:Dihydrofolate reductase n=1 Tax=Ferruginivarius sediminum TaxID=2661937 RepID=A0A369TDD1_9PROT|nr:dihydrofolate reductase [Ferruginivarius sediminum]RDD62534.1 dihydrofolate reductase [Ferruginivarius sediminum]
MTPRVTLVVAADEQGGIGLDGGLPWRLPNDLKFFKRVTAGHPLVMGRRTHESIGRALPGRTNIVISRNPDYRPMTGCLKAGSLEEALSFAAREPGGEEVMVIGGAEIFREALARAERIYLTRVHATVAADTFLPSVDPDEWRERWRESHAADECNPHAYSFILLERRSAGAA